MFDISKVYKVANIVDNDIKELYIFLGKNFIDDAQEDLSELFKKESENPIFKKIFSSDEIKEIIDKSTNFFLRRRKSILMILLKLSRKK